MEARSNLMETKMDQIETWDINRLIPYARNPRKNDHAVDRIASAIREFGFRVPIIAKSDNTVVDGHLRIKAAQKLGMETVPVLVADDLTDAQVKAFRLSVNKMAEIADWDDELLALELQELQELDFDIDLIGFDVDELEALINNVDEAELPELADGDKEPFQQVTFTLHDEQHVIVSDAVTLARTSPIVDTGLNDNSNGNAIALICEQWMRSQDGDS